MAGGRDILVAHGRDTIRLLDRRTGELLSGTWDAVGPRIAVTAQPSGGLMLAAAGLRELVWHDWPSGASRRLPAPDIFFRTDDSSWSAWTGAHCTAGTR